ncbi:multi-sensor signal transduction histidine kinase [Stanieria cyanosphaera PCC 7437]|uniref:histidine kinase n=1 Tax=Stanieria cyanosphaera (strain ATCC 29371 / PCC 7437) TaxID=111780 RepID=K9XNC3_STAC7|nr:PAS domain S-box protein [Stanieria cyanosphaera]AFZ34095.1 multi-sensor signal transduction histidine kinase [Stanieria cyanosphaera PCC 7437]
MSGESQFLSSFSLEELFDPHPLIVQPNQLLLDVIEQMQSEQTSSEFAHQAKGYVLVSDNTSLLGMVTEAELIKIIVCKKDWQDTTIAEVVLRPSIYVQQKDILEFHHLVDYFTRYQTCYLPIVDSSHQLVGVISQKKVLLATGIDITERKQAEARLESQHRQTQLLAEITRKIRQSLKLDEIMQTAVTEVQQLLACDRVLIFKLQSNHTAIAVSESVLPGLPSLWGWEISAPLLQDDYLNQYRRGEVLALTDLNQTNLSSEIKNLLAQFAIQAKLVVPILIQDQLKGLLIVHQCSRRDWQSWEIDLLKQIADQIGVALSQAQLLNNLEELVQERTFKLTEINQKLEQEIQKHQETETALRESQQKLAGILDIAEEAIIAIDQHQQIQIFNQGAEKIFGYTATEVLGEKLDILLPEAFRSIHCQHVTNFGNSETISRRMTERNTTVVGLRKNGTQFPAEASISKLRSYQRHDSEEAKSGLIFTVILQDITERQQAEAALRRSEEQLRLITNALPILIAYLDVEQRYCFNNRPHKDWFGRSCSQINGCHLQEVMGQTAYQQVRPYVEIVLSGQPVTFELELSCLGKSRWISANYIPDFNSSGNIKGFFSMVSDITERIAVERMKSEFVSVASHEMRTPLTSIHGVIRLLAAGRLGKLSPSAQNMIEIAAKNTNRLTRLIDDVLDLERMESGREIIEQKICNAAELIQQAIDTMTAMAKEYQITLSSQATDLQIWADSDKIMQTLTNLISNAIKFSRPHSQILITAEQQNSEVLFRISDRGRGIPADKLESIFERFQQVDASDSREKGGTGLGLAICRHIVQQHGGKIWVESILGEGSTFYFTLPANPTS